MTAELPPLSERKKVLFHAIENAAEQAPSQAHPLGAPEERAWLDQINRQLAYDEYMQAKRELWLAERPSAQRNERREPHDE